MEERQFDGQGRIAAMGGMADRVRAFDWSATPLGAIETWSGRLAGAVEAMLATPQLASLAVGSERTFLYNDRASRHYGARHPGVFGLPLALAFPHDIGKVAAFYDRVFAGESLHVPAQSLDPAQSGTPELFEAYLTPIRGDDGQVVAAQMTGHALGGQRHVEKKLQENEERFRALVTAGATSIYRMSADWRVMFQLNSTDFLVETAEPIEDWAGRYILPDDRAMVDEAIRRAIRTRSMFELEHRVALADGSVGWVVSRAVPMLGPDGEITEWFGAGSDITPRKRAEAALRDSEQKYQSLFAASPIPFMVLAPNSPDFTITAANDAYLAATLTTREGLLGRSVFDVFTDDRNRQDANGPEALRASLERVRASGRPDAMPRTRYDIVKPGGGFEPRWWLAIHAPVLDGAGQVGSIIHQVTDVTELHLAEMAGQEHQARQDFLLRLSDALRPLADPAEIEETAARHVGEHLNAGRAYYVHLDEGRQLATVTHEYRRDDHPSLAGQHAYSAYGATLDLLRTEGRVVFEDVEAEARISPADLPAHRALGLRAYVNTALVKEGTLVAAMCVVDAVPRRWTAAEVALVEETGERTWEAVERARAQAALRESEERLALAFRTLPLGIAIIDGGGEIVTANDGMQRFLPTGRIPSRDPERSARWRGWDADGREVQPQDFPGARALRGESVSPGMQMLYRDDAGAECWTEVLSAPLHHADGRISGAINVVVDVDRLKRSEEAAQASEERMRQFGEASQDILWIRDAESLQWVHLTPAFETIYGMGRDEALAGDNYRNWQDLIVPEDRDCAAAAVTRVRSGEHVTFEYRVRRPSDGTIRWLRNTDFPITDEAGKVILIGGVGHDVTRMKAVEAEFAASKERLRLLMDGIPQLVWRSCDQGRWTWSSPQWRDFTGQRQDESHGMGWLDAVHLDDHAAAMQAWETARPHGLLDVEYRVLRAADGAWIWHHTRSVPVRDGTGRIVEWLGTSTDIHELREMQERQKVLVAELQHRTRNLMGVVRSMADKTARASGDLVEFRSKFRDRLDALARVQGLLSRMNDHDRVTFDELVDTELKAMNGSADRVTLDGPAGVRLRSSTVQTLALALHELATNAVKYGALGQAAGRLAITWRLEHHGDGGKPWLHIEWQERGVQMPAADAAPRGTGQGRELIERALPYQLRARTSYVLGPDGVRCTISIPVSASTVEVGEHG